MAGIEVRFVGRWPRRERRIVVLAVASAEEFLAARFQTLWTFERSEGGYAVSQPALLLRRSWASTLDELIRRIAESAEFATPLN
jgi:hypothetical protein